MPRVLYARLAGPSPGDSFSAYSLAVGALRFRGFELRLYLLSHLPSKQLGLYFIEKKTEYPLSLQWFSSNVDEFDLSLNNLSAVS